MKKALLCALFIALPAAALDEFPSDFPLTLQGHKPNALNGHGGDGGQCEFDIQNKFLIIIPGNQGKADGTPGKGASEEDKSATLSICKNSNNEILIRTVDGHIARIHLTRLLMLRPTETED